MKYIIIGLFIALFLFISVNLFLKLPFIWPDESVYADVAQNVLKEGRLGTDLWSGIVPGIERCICWYPPLFFYLLAGWFKLFGASIISQRLLSLTITVGLLITIYPLTKFFLKNEKSSFAHWFYLLPAFALMIDYKFLQASRLGRPEIFILLLGSLALLFYLKSSKSSSFISGLFAGLALMTHFLGLFFILPILCHFLIIQKLKLFKSAQFYLFLAGLITTFLIWLPTILPNLDIARIQISLGWTRRTAQLEENWIRNIFSQGSWPLAAIFVGYFITSIMFLIHTVVNKKRQYYLLALTLISVWLAAFYGKLFWYFALPIPFTYVAFSLLLFDLIKLPKKTKVSIKKISSGIAVTTGAIIIFLNLQLNFDAITARGGDKYSYERLTNTVLSIIPEGKTVFLSAIPDLYFGFKQNGRKNTLYEFPSDKQTREVYGEYLNKADFAIIAGSYDWPIYGNFLGSYLEKNQLKAYDIEEPLQNEMAVVELKPRKERIIP